MKTLTRPTPSTGTPFETAGACCAPIAPVVLDGAVAATAVARFKALADPTRLTILATLAASPEPVCVCELNEGFDLEQPTISHHLKVLRDAGLVTSARRGSWAYYRLHPAAATWVEATLAALPR